MSNDYAIDLAKFVASTQYVGSKVRFPAIDKGHSTARPDRVNVDVRTRGFVETARYLLKIHVSVSRQEIVATTWQGRALFERYKPWALSGFLDFKICKPSIASGRVMVLENDNRQLVTIGIEGVHPGSDRGGS